MPGKKSKSTSAKADKVSKASRRASTIDTEKELVKEVKALSKEVRKLKELEFIKVFRHPWKFLGFSFLKGIMVGFGSVLGATVVVAIFIYLLAQISFVPIVGEFIEDVIGQLEITQEVNP